MRLLARSPRERLQTGKAHAFELQAGWTRATAGSELETRQEKGRMVSVLLSDTEQLPDALHLLADLWNDRHRADPALRATGAVGCEWDLPGSQGIVPTLTARLADDLHHVAGIWARDRERYRAQLKAAMRSPATH